MFSLVQKKAGRKHSSSETAGFWGGSHAATQSPIRQHMAVLVNEPSSDDELTPILVIFSLRSSTKSSTHGHSAYSEFMSGRFASAPEFLLHNHCNHFSFDYPAAIWASLMSPKSPEIEVFGIRGVWCFIRDRCCKARTRVLLGD